MSEPNQLQITSRKKDSAAYGAGNWGYFPFSETFEAYRDLSPAGFGLYLMLMRDKPHFQRDLYRVEYEKLTGRKRTTYYNALQELKDKGYLVQVSGTAWNFFPDSQFKKPDSD